MAKVLRQISTDKCIDKAQELESEFSLNTTLEFRALELSSSDAVFIARSIARFQKKAENAECPIQ